MVTTPLITKIKSNGGTLYTFTSTSNDLTRVATNGSNYQFKFSHFACLNLPPIMEGNMSTMIYGDVDGVDSRVFNRVESEVTYDTFHINVNITDKYIDRVKTCEIVGLDSIDGKYFIEGNQSNIYKFDISPIDENISINFKVKLTLDDGSIIETKDLKYDADYVGTGVEKGIYLKQFEDYDYPVSGDFNVAMAEHFQNYILNFESVILNSTTSEEKKDDETDENKSEDSFETVGTLRSPAERIFFNWLRKVGAIRFEKVGTNDNNKPLFEEFVRGYHISDYDNIDSTISDKNLKKDRTVQYIGNIDTLNQVEVNGDTFGEVYLYIPSSVGATPTIKFRTVNDANYKFDNYIWGSEKIVGRDNFKNEDRPVDGISLDAIYDNDEGVNIYVGDSGYCLDFNVDDYYKSTENKKSFSNYISESNTNSYYNFEFNCILIYYDIIKKDINNQETYATNLYGVLFLDNFKPDNASTTDRYLAHIDTLPKLKNHELSEGNSFALKLDLKFDTAPTTTMSRVESDCSCVQDGDIYTDPNNSKGFALYSSALEQLHKCIDIFYTQQNEIYQLQDRVEELESLILTQADVKNIQIEVEELKKNVESIEVVDKNTVLNLINDYNDTLGKIINGKYPTKLFLDSNAITVGSGLSLNQKLVEDKEDKNTKKYVINIDNTLQHYNYVGQISLKSNPDSKYISMKDNVVNLNLMEHSNLVLLSENSDDISDIPLTSTLIFNINCENTEWKHGQTYKFEVYNDFKFNDIIYQNVIFQTKLKDKNIVPIKEFDYGEIKKLKNKTSIEIMFIDSGTNDFRNNFLTFIR